MEMGLTAGEVNPPRMNASSPFSFEARPQGFDFFYLPGFLKESQQSDKCCELHIDCLVLDSERRLTDCAFIVMTK